MEVYQRPCWSSYQLWPCSHQPFRSLLQQIHSNSWDMISPVQNHTNYSLSLKIWRSMAQLALRQKFTAASLVILLVWKILFLLKSHWLETITVSLSKDAALTSWAFKKFLFLFHHLQLFIKFNLMTSVLQHLIDSGADIWQWLVYFSFSFKETAQEKGPLVHWVHANHRSSIH